MPLPFSPLSSPSPLSLFLFVAVCGCAVHGLFFIFVVVSVCTYDCLPVLFHMCRIEASKPAYSFFSLTSVNPQDSSNKHKQTKQIQTQLPRTQTWQEHARNCFPCCCCLWVRCHKKINHISTFAPSICFSPFSLLSFFLRANESRSLPCKWAHMYMYVSVGGSIYSTILP
jgi:hypothetical protein